jgi:hypothetical protein
VDTSFSMNTARYATQNNLHILVAHPSGISRLIIIGFFWLLFCVKFWPPQNKEHNFISIGPMKNLTTVPL